MYNEGSVTRFSYPFQFFESRFLVSPRLEKLKRVTESDNRTLIMYECGTESQLLELCVGQNLGS